MSRRRPANAPGYGPATPRRYRGEVPIREIKVDELDGLITVGAVVIDVRELDEWTEARVPGVQLIPLGELEVRSGEIPEADTVFVICRSGARSLRACEWLVAGGTDAVNVAGGTLAWIDSGRPTETGPA